MAGEDRPLLLDAACKAGGAGMGYHRAGFRVIGCDVEPQPRYPFEFVQADARALVEQLGWMFDAFHGSPPCHDHTSLRSRAGLNGTGHLLADFREAFEATGKPWVIENVPGAPLRPDVILCAETFDLRTVRHRWFESNVPLVGRDHPLGAAHRWTGPGGTHLRRTTTRKRRPDFAKGYNVSVTGDVGSWVGMPCLGIDWMTGDELSQAIPPAYTEHIGRQLLEVVRGTQR
jgi:DNA (cytosine-5)-methyltransferase 1